LDRVKVISPAQGVLWVDFEGPGGLGLACDLDSGVFSDAIARYVGKSVDAVLLWPNEEGGRVSPERELEPSRARNVQSLDQLDRKGMYAQGNRFCFTTESMCINPQRCPDRVGERWSICFVHIDQGRDDRSSIFHGVDDSDDFDSPSPTFVKGTCLPLVIPYAVCPTRPPRRV